MSIKLVENKSLNRFSLGILLFTISFLLFSIGTKTSQTDEKSNLSMLGLLIGSQDQNSSLLASNGTSVSLMIKSDEGGTIQLGKELNQIRSNLKLNLKSFSRFLTIEYILLLEFSIFYF